jgi:hypothetical protein
MVAHPEATPFWSYFMVGGNTPDARKNVDIEQPAACRIIPLMNLVLL